MGQVTLKVSQKEWVRLSNLLYKASRTKDEEEDDREHGEDDEWYEAKREEIQRRLTKRLYNKLKKQVKEQNESAHNPSGNGSPGFGMVPVNPALAKRNASHGRSPLCRSKPPKKVGNRDPNPGHVLK